MNGLALCAGAAGLELGLGLALGDTYRTVGYVERDAYAATVLVARMAEQTLEPAPLWDDVATFDGRFWRGKVDIIAAGFPCQPFSAAGEQRGLEDERWLWPHIARIVRQVGPSYVFMENVPLLHKRGLGVILGDLAEAGFNAEWGCLAAGEVGATHKRDRIWVLAYRERDGLTQLWREGIQHRIGQALGDDADGSRGEDAWFPPGPDEWNGWHGPQPSVRRDADGLAARMDRLHTIGNGVVPLVAATAFIRLVERAVA